jgi:hypothetical protein
VAGDEDDRHVNPVDSDTLLQFETVARGRERNSWAEAKVSGRHPEALMSSSSDSRTETSSSTTKTTDVTSGIVTTSIARPADDRRTVYGARAALSVGIVIILTSPAARR